MNTMRAYMMGQEARRNGNPMKVFDWDKAAEIIRDQKLTDVDAGLSRDLEYTKGTILEDGKPVRDRSTYLASIWATPVLCVWNDQTCSWDETSCWKYEKDTPNWNAETRWPDSALKLLGFTKDDVKNDYDDEEEEDEENE